MTRLALQSWLMLLTSRQALTEVLLTLRSAEGDRHGAPSLVGGALFRPLAFCLTLAKMSATAGIRSVRRTRNGQELQKHAVRGIPTMRGSHALYSEMYSV